MGGLRNPFTGDSEGTIKMPGNIALNLLILLVSVGTADSICCDEIKAEVHKKTLAYQTLCSDKKNLFANCCSVIGGEIKKQQLAYETLCPKRDVNNCLSSPCHKNSTCNDTQGSLICTCYDGFQGDGYNCTAKTFLARFTNLGASGRFGPNSTGSFYVGKNHENMVTVANGIQTWTVPFTAKYQITAVGAVGGYGASKPNGRGYGAYMKGEFLLNKGQLIRILVGQHGAVNYNAYSSGGGGGTFVATSSNTPLIVGGGGGGTENLATRLSNCDASNGTSGNQNQCKNRCSAMWSGGANGRGASDADSDNSGGGGGGFYSSGRSSKQFGGAKGNGGEGGKGFLQGGAGGRSWYNNGWGGFGGGGGAYGSGGGAGGGGGYSGGASGENENYSCGGGGGSYNSGKNQLNIQGYQKNGHGYVEIKRIL